MTAPLLTSAAACGTVEVGIVVGMSETSVGGIVGAGFWVGAGLGVAVARFGVLVGIRVAVGVG